MKNKLLKRLKIEPYTCVCIGLTALFVVLSFTVFSGAFMRLVAAVKDIGMSIVYYFFFLFKIDITFVPSVTIMPDVPLTDIPLLPSNLDLFGVQLSMWGNSLITGDTYKLFLVNLLQGSRIILLIATLFIGVGLIFHLLVKESRKKTNNNYDADTKALKMFKRLSKVTYQPIRHIFRQFKDYLKEHRLWSVLWLVIWLFNFNLISIGLDAFAFLLYLVMSFDFANIYVQFCKLFLDLKPMFDFVPPILWVPLCLGIFHWYRKKRGMIKLYRNEALNEVFLDKMPLVLTILGLMGMGKTKLMTDLALTQDVLFHKKAFELLLKNDMKFAYFPWIVFELHIAEAMDTNEIFNLASCRKWVQSLRKEFEDSPSSERLFGYDYNLYGLEYDDNLGNVYVWDVLETYAQLYYIFVLDTALIVSNYSIRLEDFISTVGNLPTYRPDFFQKTPEEQAALSRHSKILDYDVLRLGKKMLDKNPLSGSFEFGAVVMTEVDKERGNMNTLEDIKKGSETANQKNDLFAYSPMLARHPATVDFFPFVRYLMDAQRAGSVGASTRELSQILTVVGSSDERYTIGRLFHLEDWILGGIVKKLNEWYTDTRFRRGDHTLVTHFFTTVKKSLNNYLTRLKNQYGFSILALEVEKGTLDGAKEEYTYYMQNKKIYAFRYSTDCYGGFFANQTLRANVGLLDYAEYEKTNAEITDLRRQNAYLIRDLDNFTAKKKEEKKGSTTKR